jgi:Flp pilus assembly pilin Flp
MLHKIRELLSQKGQGVVEYALLLGLVAVVAAYLIGGSGLIDAVKVNINDVKSTLESARLNS